jgi:hypothetical protein
LYCLGAGLSPISLTCGRWTASGSTEANCESVTCAAGTWSPIKAHPSTSRCLTTLTAAFNGSAPVGERLGPNSRLYRHVCRELMTRYREHGTCFMPISFFDSALSVHTVEKIFYCRNTVTAPRPIVYTTVHNLVSTTPPCFDVLLSRDCTSQLRVRTHTQHHNPLSRGAIAANFRFTAIHALPSTTKNQHNVCCIPRYRALESF